MPSVEPLLERIRAHRLKVDEDLVRLAYDFAAEAHKDNSRLSGEPYIVHPLAVAHTLADLKLDQTTIIAGLLHDIAEDTPVAQAEIEKNFGPEVGQLVAGVTKLGKLKYRGMERYIENLRKMFVAIAEDVRVILIKFADRIHNLETIQYLPAPKQERVARESLEIYAPIANRLGMGDIKGRLEDLAFPVLYQKEYAWVAGLVQERIDDLETILTTVKQRLLEELSGEGVAVIDIHGRRKHLWSLYQKLLQPQYDRDITKITDLIALRVVVPSITDCYAVLGVVHKHWRPIPGRIKDYIAQPKPNGYRSIHTTVFVKHGQLLEVQIRDLEMHRQAEFGVAAHWHYDEAGKPKRAAPAPNEHIAWIRELSDWKREYATDEQYLEALKIDVFHNRIFVFTPKGEVIDLPEDSTPVDFAYAVHSDLGTQCTGSRVNGHIAPLDTALKSGDVVEILRDKNRRHPNADWLLFVKTHLARTHIRRGARDDARSLLAKTAPAVTASRRVSAARLARSGRVATPPRTPASPRPSSPARRRGRRG